MIEEISKQEEKRLLRERGEALARVPEETDPKDNLEVLVFELSQEMYAVEPRYVTEVVPLRQMTPVPCTPDYILGIVNVRGRLVSVLDLRRFFELPLRGLSDRNSVVVIADDTMEFGLLTDRMVGTRIVSRRHIRHRLAHLSGVRSNYLLGVTISQWAVLDAEKLLSDTTLVINETV